MSKLNKYAAAMLCACMLIAGCKKDDADTGISLVGTWQLANATEKNYYTFNDNKTVDLLEENGIGGHTVLSKAYQLLDNTLNIGGGDIYKVEQSGDSLFLYTSPDQSKRYVKVSTISREEWVTSLQLELEMDGYFSPAIAYNGSELVVVDNTHYMYSKLHFINPVAKNITNTLGCSESYEGFEFAGGKYWGTKESDDVLYTVSSSTGQVLSTSVSAPRDIVALAGNNTELYCLASNNGYIYTYNIAAGTFDVGVSFSGFTIRDMAYRNGYLYLVSDSYVYKCSMAPFKVEKTYYAPNVYISGIAFDGSGNAWLMDGEDGLFKTQLN